MTPTVAIPLPCRVPTIEIVDMKIETRIDGHAELTVDFVVGGIRVERFATLNVKRWMDMFGDDCPCCSASLDWNLRLRQYGGALN